MNWKQKREHTQTRCGQKKTNKFRIFAMTVENNEQVKRTAIDIDMCCCCCCSLSVDIRHQTENCSGIIDKIYVECSARKKGRISVGFFFLLSEKQ